MSFKMSATVKDQEMFGRATSLDKKEAKYELHVEFGPDIWATVQVLNHFSDSYSRRFTHIDPASRRRQIAR